MFRNSWVNILQVLTHTQSKYLMSYFRGTHNIKSLQGTVHEIWKSCEKFGHGEGQILLHT